MRRIGNKEKSHIETFKEIIMFNPLKMAGDLKGIENAETSLEKFMQDSGFVKSSEFRELEKE